MARKPGFEQQMKRLQDIAAELERDDLPLERSVALYKEGQALVASCRALLEKARHAVTVRDDSGVHPFDCETEEDGEEA